MLTCGRAGDSPPLLSYVAVTTKGEATLPLLSYKGRQLAEIAPGPSVRGPGGFVCKGRQVDRADRWLQWACSVIMPTLLVTEGSGSFLARRGKVTWLFRHFRRQTCFTCEDKWELILLFLNYDT